MKKAQCSGGIPIFSRHKVELSPSEGRWLQHFLLGCAANMEDVVGQYWAYTIDVNVELRVVQIPDVPRWFPAERLHRNITDNPGVCYVFHDLMLLWFLRN